MGHYVKKKFVINELEIFELPDLSPLDSCLWDG